MWPDTMPLWVGVLLWLVLWCAGSVCAGLVIGRFIAVGRGKGGEE